MFYDLNVPWSVDQVELQKTLSFLSELGYNVVALDHTLTGKVTAETVSLATSTSLSPAADREQSCSIPEKLPFPTPRSLRILRRCTVVLVDPSQNHRLATLASHYDILALRPTNERALLQACQSLECDLISLDLSTRFPYYFKMKTLSGALQRGIKFEICYASGVLLADGGLARRNLISNATQLIRATRGRGIIISSEAKRALACRGPWDVVNLAAVWGLGQEKGVEAVGREARSVVVQAEMKRTSFRGVINVVYGGEKPEKSNQGSETRGKDKPSSQQKRKADAMDDEAAGDDAQIKLLSKRQRKLQAKHAQFEAIKEKDGSLWESDELQVQPSGEIKLLSKRGQKRQAKQAELDITKVKDVSSRKSDELPVQIGGEIKPLPKRGQERQAKEAGLDAMKEKDGSFGESDELQVQLGGEIKPLSKRGQKRQAKQAELDVTKVIDDSSRKSDEFPVQTGGEIKPLSKRGQKRQAKEAGLDTTKEKDGSFEESDELQVQPGGETKPLSKRGQKRQAKQAKLDALKVIDDFSGESDDLLVQPGGDRLKTASTIKDD
ncbi:hypothetical protein MMC29_004049 [Sticta canariensis]|nr:hypothetical protein [Sticta canariensis]